MHDKYSISSSTFSYQFFYLQLKNLTTERVGDGYACIPVPNAEAYTLLNMYEILQVLTGVTRTIQPI